MDVTEALAMERVVETGPFDPSGMDLPVSLAEDLSVTPNRKVGADGSGPGTSADE